MSAHFRAFSFVDRITSAGDDGRLEGLYVIPSGLGRFPPSLAAEAVGQLAAWGSMRASNFARRPIAGLAGRVDLLLDPKPGQVLQLIAHIQSLDDEAVAYHGSAMVQGHVIIRLEDCVGPMVPAGDLDDPSCLRERFGVLCGAGAPPGAFPGLPPLAPQRTNGENAQWILASLHVPASSAMFADHFPRRPVFPGSLLIQMCLELASTLAGEIPPPDRGRWRPQSVLNMKLREFIPPGKMLELEARLKERTNDSATLSVSVRMGGELVGSARLLLEPEVCQ